MHGGVTGTQAHLCVLAPCQCCTQRPGETQQAGESLSLAAFGLHKGRGLNHEGLASLGKDAGQIFPELLTLQEVTDTMQDFNINN